MNGRILALPVCVCLLVSSAGAVETSDRQIMANLASDAARDALALDVSVPSSQQVIALIQEERFLEFEKLSKQYETSFSKEPKYKSPLYKLYGALNLVFDKESVDGAVGTGELILRKLDKWVEARPSYISYGARGAFQTNLGYGIRGGEYISKTPSHRVESMRAYHRAAKADLLLALKENNKFGPAYLNLILIERASGSTEQAKQIADAAAKYLPQSYYIPAAYLEALKPRWGGSYESMETYASSLSIAVPLNARVFNLRADAPAERAYSAVLAKDYLTAIRFYTEALSYGDRPSFLYWRGRSYKELRQHDLALADFKRYTRYRQDNTEVNHWIEYLSKTSVREAM